MNNYLIIENQWKENTIRWGVKITHTRAQTGHNLPSTPLQHSSHYSKPRLSFSVSHPSLSLSLSLIVLYIYMKTAVLGFLYFLFLLYMIRFPFLWICRPLEVYLICICIAICRFLYMNFDDCVPLIMVPKYRFINVESMILLHCSLL